MKLGLREANQQFSRIVRAIRAGREVVLTDRGEAIAVVKPLERRGREKAFQAMVAEGLIRPSRRRGPMKVSRFRALKVTGRPVAETISSDREERF
jgi:antitoxin (DNA-binding transcriptional repressor) of toxin-antitoxin stability system